MPAGRFAPSPTSDLHLGNLRTALLSWLFARDAGLGFLLRIEDLDQQRVAAAPGIAAHQLADLAALGLDWDGPVVQHQGGTSSIGTPPPVWTPTSASVPAARSPKRPRRRTERIVPTPGPARG